MKDGLFKRLKDTVKSELSAEDPDAVAETIVVDLSAPEETVATSQVLRRGEGGEGRSMFRATAGFIYVLDLRPFYEALGVGADDRMAESLVNFCDTLFERAIGHDGTHVCHQGEQFFFQLNKGAHEGWRMALEMVNEIGAQFLRDSFVPEEFVPAVLAAVDAAQAVGSDGVVDPDRLMAARTRPVLGPGGTDAGPVWLPFGGATPGEEPDLVWDTDEREDVDPEWQSMEGGAAHPDADPEWHEAARQQRRTGRQVERGQERRLRKSHFYAGEDRRRRARGRRDVDDPRQSVW